MRSPSPLALTPPARCQAPRTSGPRSATPSQRSPPRPIAPPARPSTTRAPVGRRAAGGPGPPPPGTGRPRACKRQARRTDEPTGTEAPPQAKQQGQSRAAAAAAWEGREAQACAGVLTQLQAILWLPDPLPVAAFLRVKYSGVAEAVLAAVAAAAAGQWTPLHVQGRTPGKQRGPRLARTARKVRVHEVEPRDAAKEQADAMRIGPDKGGGHGRPTHWPCHPRWHRRLTVWPPHPHRGRGGLARLRRRAKACRRAA